MYFEYNNKCMLAFKRIQGFKRRISKESSESGGNASIDSEFHKVSLEEDAHISKSQAGDSSIQLFK